MGVTATVYTATISNVAQENTGIRIYADFSDGSTRNYLFDSSVTKSQVVSTIKLDIDNLNTASQKTASAQAFIGTVIS